jgi:hypothetical protein
MKRIAWLTVTAALVASCEQAAGPAPSGLPAFSVFGSRTTYSGEATVVRLALDGLTPIELGKAGPLPPEGGAQESTVLSIDRSQTAGVLAADVVGAAVVGQGDTSRAEAFVANPSLSVPVLGAEIRADVLRSEAEATCDGAGKADASGSSEIAGLSVNGEPIEVSGDPNQTIDIAGVTIVINEQSGSANGNRADITVNALHVTARDPLTNTLLLDVVISSAHADISCAGCNPPIGDFVTGGGWITGPSSGARATFAVAGGIKNDGWWGHLTYIDHGGDGLRVKGTGVTAYEVTGSVSRHIEGTAEVNGVPGFTYKVDVTDNGEPGRADTFALELSNGYRAEGTLQGGNIQLHARPSPCP